MTGNNRKSNINSDLRHRTKHKRRKNDNKSINNY